MLSRFAFHRQAAFAAATRPLTKTSAATPLYTTTCRPYFSAARQPLLQTKNSMSITQQRVGLTNWIGVRPLTSIIVSKLLCLGLGGSYYLLKNKSNFQEWTVIIQSHVSAYTMSREASKNLTWLDMIKPPFLSNMGLDQEALMKLKEISTEELEILVHQDDIDLVLYHMEKKIAKIYLRGLSSGDAKHFRM